MTPWNSRFVWPRVYHPTRISHSQSFQRELNRRQSRFMSLTSLNQMASQLSDEGDAAPVHLWDPPFCGDIDIEIRRDGSWWHEGRPIRRKGMAELFASILLYEKGEHFLVTPAEKVRIRVEDCPFLLTELRVENAGDPSIQRLLMRTSLGEEVAVGREHPLVIGD